MKTYEHCISEVRFVGMYKMFFLLLLMSQYVHLVKDLAPISSCLSFSFKLLSDKISVLAPYEGKDTGKKRSIIYHDVMKHPEFLFYFNLHPHLF